MVIFNNNNKKFLKNLLLQIAGSGKDEKPHSQQQQQQKHGCRFMALVCVLINVAMIRVERKLRTWNIVQSLHIYGSLHSHSYRFYVAFFPFLFLRFFSFVNSAILSTMHNFASLYEEQYPCMKWYIHVHWVRYVARILLLVIIFINKTITKKNRANIWNNK